VTCDGEAKQIEVFQEEDVLGWFSLAMVDFGKTPASCSGICQSSDVSPFFRAVKKVLKGILNDILYKNAVISDKLRHLLLLPPFDNMSSERRSKIVEAMQQVVFVIKATLNESVIKQGYKFCGQYPLSYDTAMGKCTRLLTELEAASMSAAFPRIKQLFLENGCVTEAQLDDLNIINVNAACHGKIAKDLRALHQQRSVIMNSANCTFKYKQYQLAKLTAEAERLNLAEVRIGKKNAVAAAKLRWNAMTLGEQKAEKAAKAKATRERNRDALMEKNRLMNLPEPNLINIDVIDHNDLSIWADIIDFDHELA
jgi:hypothetical protein